MSDTKILVFDDDLVHHPLFFEGLPAIFRFRGDGREALQEVKTWAPDLVLMDYAPDAGSRIVPDPYYGEAEDFERVLDLVEAGCAGLLAALSPAPRTRPA